MGKYRACVERYVVILPFINHTDTPKRNKQGHNNHPHPTDPEAIGMLTATGEEASNKQPYNYVSKLRKRLKITYNLSG